MRARRWISAAGPVVVALGALGAAPALAAGTDRTPDYEMPFPCNDTWTGTTRADHSPSPFAIDWNKTGDLGALMDSAAPGTVRTVADLGNTSYGRYIIVDHGDGHSTLYAHLEAQWVTAGQTVDQGTPLGLVGGTGNATGPHLHFEERLDGQDQRPYFHQSDFVMGSTQASQNCPDVPVAGVWAPTTPTGSPSDVGVFRRSKVGGKFRLHMTGVPTVVIPFGRAGDQPVTGDWNGDGTTDVGVRRPGARAFLLRNADGSTTRIKVGTTMGVPVIGDWDGDGRADVGLWNPATRKFTERTAGGQLTKVRLGAVGDLPITGDWNGDGATDLGVYDPATQTFTRVTKTSDGTTTRAVQFGDPADLPVTGDWNGNGSTDVGTWSPSTATFALRTPGSKSHRGPKVTLVRFGRVR
jgi:murein DD-endopeptidase MepM/ murein hydrolase activator NlpD